MRRISQQVADCFSENGYAFVEDDKLEALAAVLTLFLADAEISVNVPADASPRALSPAFRSRDRPTVS
jgi:hypothetical protein